MKFKIYLPFLFVLRLLLLIEYVFYINLSAIAWRPLVWCRIFLTEGRSLACFVVS